MTSYDWMHIYLVSGLWNSEIPLLMNAINTEHGIGVQALANFLKTVTWPKKISSKGTAGIKAVEKHKEGHLSCSASEGLSLYASLRCFLQTKVPQSAAGSAAFKAVRSYYCLAAVLDLLVKTRKGAVLPDEPRQLSLTNLQFYMFGPPVFIFPRIAFLCFKPPFSCFPRLSSHSNIPAAFPRNSSSLSKLT